MSIQLDRGQLERVYSLKNGNILCGDVGTGKSRTALRYYYILCGGNREALEGGKFKPLRNPKPLYIITTRRKRDTLEWEGELTYFLMNKNTHPLTIDSWNNISKYKNISGAFFIFDEQRVVGHGEWVKSFLQIARNNEWILLSATPGDTWTDYIPVFIANGFYKNRTQFYREHVIMSRYTKYPKVEKYLNTGKLLRQRNEILVNIEHKKNTVRHPIELWCEYDILQYKRVMRERWDIWENKPIENASALCYALRKVVNSDIDRIKSVQSILELKHKCIVFYNFDYELDLLLSNFWGEDVEVHQWNGHKHETVPDGDKWLYLVQYTAGAEGWNCTSTDTIIFYSQSYSYKAMIQRAGRIDRRNTPYVDLYYYSLKSRRAIDLAINRSLRHKKDFNANNFVKKL